MADDSIQASIQTTEECMEQCSRDNQDRVDEDNLVTTGVQNDNQDVRDENLQREILTEERLIELNVDKNNFVSEENIDTIHKEIQDTYKEVEYVGNKNPRENLHNEKRNGSDNQDQSEVQLTVNVPQNDGVDTGLEASSNVDPPQVKIKEQIDMKTVDNPSYDNVDIKDSDNRHESKRDTQGEDKDICGNKIKVNNNNYGNIEEENGNAGIDLDFKKNGQKIKRDANTNEVNRTLALANEVDQTKLDEVFELDDNIIERIEQITNEFITDREVSNDAVPRTEGHDNDRCNGDTKVNLKGDAEVNDDVDIDELQKLIEDQHLTKCNNQDPSDAELTNRGTVCQDFTKAELTNKGHQEAHSDRPYYEKVPSISVGKGISGHFTPNMPILAQLPSPINKCNSADRRLSTRQSVRIPPAIVKMSNVMLTAKKRRAAVLRSMSQYYEVKRHAKLLRWDECMNSRPPLPFDLDLPGPCHYSPTNKPLYETNAPEYSFGMRFYEKGGGARTAHAKTWFNSTSSYTTKVNFEKRWPSPAQYSHKPLLGRRSHTLPDFPVYSIGVRSKFAINKKGSELEPSPNEYYPNKSIRLTLPSAPAYSFGSRHSGTCTSIGDTDPNNPGPDNYTPQIKFIKPHRPSFTIKGVRVPKSHVLGPHATL